MSFTVESVLRRAHDLGVAEWSDWQLVAYAADRLRIPRVEPADSFVLHSPLELLARSALLAGVTPRGRDLARLRVLALVDYYEAYEAYEPVASSEVDADDPDTAMALLAQAAADADLDAADRAAVGLAAIGDPREIAARLAPIVLPHLAAAAHAPIFLAHLPRVAPRAEVTAQLLRPLVRELCRYGALQLEWVRDRPSQPPAHHERESDLLAAIGAVPRLGVPGSTFIYPLMHQVDETNTAREVVGAATLGLAPDAAARVLLRAAARAMLVEDPAHAPYGWTHCLTMPQGALGIAGTGRERQLAVDVAATYVVGFLAAQARAELPETLDLEYPGGTFGEAVATSGAAAAGWAWHAPADDPPALWAEIVTRASIRHDAHLVKYTLACRDAAAADPPAAPLFRAAAASLLAFWEAVDDPDDPLRELLVPVA